MSVESDDIFLEDRSPKHSNPSLNKKKKNVT